MTFSKINVPGRNTDGNWYVLVGMKFDDHTRS